jgi:hypothetical protein
VPPRSAISIRTEQHLQGAIVRDERALRNGRDTIIPWRSFLKKTVGMKSGTFIVQVIADSEQNPVEVFEL